jgi:hypothetical protein
MIDIVLSWIGRAIESRRLEWIATFLLASGGAYFLAQLVRAVWRGVLIPG